jgi:O-antigen/teichoic acid export membrane protein
MQVRDKPDHFRCGDEVPPTGLLATLIAGIRGSRGYWGAVSSFYILSGIQVLIQIILMPLYLDTLGKIGTAILVTILALVSVAGLGINWMHGGALRVLGERYFRGQGGGTTELDCAYSAVKLLCLGYGAVAAAIIAFLSLLPTDILFGEIGAKFSSEAPLALLLAALYYLLLSNMTSEYWTLSATQHQAEANIALSAGALTFAAAIVPWLLSGGGIAGAMGCLLLSGIVSTVTAKVFVRVRLGRLRFKPGRQSFTLARGFVGCDGLPYAVYGAGFTVLQADSLILSVLCGAETVVEFVMVWKIAEFVTLLLWKIPESLQPYLIEAHIANDHDRILRFYRMMWRSVFILALMAGVLYAVFGDWLVTLWVGPEHATMPSWAFMLAGAAMFWMALARVPSLFSYALKRFRWLNRIVPLEVVAKLAVIAALVPVLGFAAPFAAVCLIHVLGIAWAYIYIGRQLLSVQVVDAAAPAVRGNDEN